MSPCTSNMILSAFLARIREMSSNRGVVSAVSTFVDAFCSAQGYCVKKTPPRSGKDRSG